MDPIPPAVDDTVYACDADNMWIALDRLAGPHSHISLAKYQDSKIAYYGLKLLKRYTPLRYVVTGYKWWHYIGIPATIIFQITALFFSIFIGPALVGLLRLFLPQNTVNTIVDNTKLRFSQLQLSVMMVWQNLNAQFAWMLQKVYPGVYNNKYAVFVPQGQIISGNDERVPLADSSSSQKASSVVVLPHETDYQIVLRNFNRWACDCALSLDGKQLGIFRLEPAKSYTIQHPSMAQNRFHFIDQSAQDWRKKDSSSMSGSSGSNGTIEARFVPVDASKPNESGFFNRLFGSFQSNRTQSQAVQGSGSGLYDSNAKMTSDEDQLRWSGNKSLGSGGMRVGTVMSQMQSAQKFKRAPRFQVVENALTEISLQLRGGMVQPPID